MLQYIECKDWNTYLVTLALYNKSKYHCICKAKKLPINGKICDAMCAYQVQDSVDVMVVYLVLS